MKKASRFLLLLIAVLCGASCGPTRTRVKFDPKPFATQNYNLVLCLDLQEDLSPSAGLLVNPYPSPNPSPRSGANPSSTPLVNGSPSASSTPSATVSSSPIPTPSLSPSFAQRFVVLPFESVEAQSNEDLVSTWGSYRQFTLVSYFSSDKMGFGNGIGISPRIPIYRPEEMPTKESSRESVYMVASGETRTLFFRFLPKQEQSSILPLQLQHVPLDSLDAIAVKLPNDVAQVAGSSFINESPMHEAERSDLKIRYYPGNSARTNVGNLELSYMLKPNSIQNLFVEYALKVLGMLFVPALTLYFLRREGTTSPEKRKLLLWGLAITQGLIIVSVVVYYAVFGVSESQVKAILDAVIVLGGGVLGQAVVLLTAKEKKA